MADWEPSVNGDDLSQMTDLSIDTKLVDREINSKQAITYKLLLEHIQNAEGNFNRIVTSNGANYNSSRDAVSQFLSNSQRK